MRERDSYPTQMSTTEGTNVHLKESGPMDWVTRVFFLLGLLWTSLGFSTNPKTQFENKTYENHSPGIFTMWNDITGREETRGQHIRKTGDNKNAPTVITSDSPLTSPSPDPAPFAPINTTNS